MRVWRIFWLWGIIWILFQIPSIGDAAVEWNVQQAFKLKNPPLDIAVSRSGKWIFVLTSAGEIAIYSASGVLEDTIPVGTGVNRIQEGPEENLLVLSNRENSMVQLLSFDFIQNINIAGAPVRGDANAPVTIVLFAEFQ